MKRFTKKRLYIISTLTRFVVNGLSFNSALKNLDLRISINTEFALISKLLE